MGRMCLSGDTERALNLALEVKDSFKEEMTSERSLLLGQRGWTSVPLRRRSIAAFGDMRVCGSCSWGVLSL